VLRIGKQKVPVWVLDESARGFAIVADRHPGVAADDVARLCTDSGWHEVRVVRVSSYEPATADNEASSENAQRRFRVGLERLRDLAPGEANRGFHAWFDRLWIAGLLPAGSGTAAMAVLVVFVLTVGLTMGALVLRHSGRTVGTSRAPLPERAEDSSLVLSMFPGQPNNARSQRPNEAHGAGSTGKPHVSEVMSGRVAATVDALPGASPFALKEVAQELGLSESQREEIRRIIEASDQAIRQLSVRWPNQTRQQHEQKRQILFDEARRRALQLLTNEQRAQWEALQSGRSGSR
jgi:hypothetical protein